jgi:hypothetical protein
MYKSQSGYNAKVIIFLFILLLLFTIIEAQNGRVLFLYGRDNSLLPEISAHLEKLTVCGTDKMLFSKIENLNIRFMDLEDKQELEKLMRYYESELSLRSKSNRNRENDQRFMNLLMQDKRHKSYMRIEINSIGDLIEVRALITDSLDKIDPQYFLNLITPASRYCSFYIKMNDGDIGYQIDHGLRLLFPETNRPPNPIIFSGQSSLSENDTIYEPVGTSIVLDASRSSDPDDPIEYMAFKWHITGPYQFYDDSGSSQSQDISSIGNTRVIECNTPAFFKVELQASDGIANMCSGVKYIYFIQKPILLHDSVYIRSDYLLQRDKDIDIIVYDPNELGAKPDIMMIYKTPKRPVEDLFKIHKNEIVPQDVTTKFSVVSAGNSDSSLHKYTYRIIGDFTGNSKYIFALRPKCKLFAGDSTTFYVVHKERQGLFRLKPAIGRIGGFIPSKQESDVFWSEYAPALRSGLEIGFTSWLSFEYGSNYYFRASKAGNRPSFVRNTTAYYQFYLGNFFTVGGRQADIYYGYTWGFNFGKVVLDIPVYFEFTYYPKGWHEISLCFNPEFTTNIFGPLTICAVSLLPFIKDVRF